MLFPSYISIGYNKHHFKITPVGYCFAHPIRQFGRRGERGSGGNGEWGIGNRE